MVRQKRKDKNRSLNELKSDELAKCVRFSEVLITYECNVKEAHDQVLILSFDYFSRHLALGMVRFEAKLPALDAQFQLFIR
jgi:hypothetical protein